MKPPKKRRGSSGGQARRKIDKKQAFLRAYTACSSIKAAAAAVGVDRAMHYRWLRQDPDYHLKFQDAKQQATDQLEDEAVERAMKGVFEPNVFQGRFVFPQEEYISKPAVLDRRGRVIEPEQRAWRDKPGAAPFGIWKKSDGLLMFLLRGFMPEKYGYRGQFELSGRAGDPMEIVERLNAGRERATAAAAKRDKSLQEPETIH